MNSQMKNSPLFLFFVFVNDFQFYFLSCVLFQLGILLVSSLNRNLKLHFLFNIPSLIHITRLSPKRNCKNQDQEEKIPMARENMEDFIEKSSFESETEESESKEEKLKMHTRRLKTGVILILCFLLLNFVLVVIAMNRTSENSSQSSTKIDKQLKILEKENGELKKSHKELKEQFESLSQKIDQLKIPPSKSITSCSVAMETVPSPRSKKQTIYPHGNGSRMSLEVLCDFEVDGGGWTIIQKRSNGPKEEFSQNWTEYKNGFGSLQGNFWMGLDNIHSLTKNGDQELRIQLEDFEGEKKYAKYSNFSISDSSDFYRLRVSGFYSNSTLKDSIDYGNGSRFSTKDKDNDENSMENCAVTLGGGGWWFKDWGLSNLNGRYFGKGETVPHGQGIWWYLWKDVSLAKSEIKIRTRKSE